MALRYSVGLEHAADHLVSVELRFEPSADHVDIALPAWCPGSYLIRDYARFVRELTATADGRPVVATKLDKQTWRIAASGAREICVRYQVYGHELTVRTNHIDGEHAFLHGPATFAYPIAQTREAIEVSVRPPAGWQVITAAPKSGEHYTAESIDALFDAPFHVGRVTVIGLASKVPARIAIWGERVPGGPFDEARLAADLGAIVDDHVARFGEAPFHDYTFILMLAHDAYGGLEHRASSVNLFNPHFAGSRKHYEGLLELLSHELFHAWNGKRIAPKPLLDFDYAHEAYTPCLWVMEGITSHYDRFALRTSNRITGKSLLDKILDDWARLQATPGRGKQSLEQSSFDAWIKLYKPDESNLNTTVSYYLKGGLAMVALDLQIRRRTEGAKSLDDVLRAMWRDYGVPRVPHPDDLQPVFEAATGLALAETFDRVIRGTEDPDLATELAHVGLELKATFDPAQIADGLSAVWLGATASGTKLTGVFDGSPAQRAGLAPGDELVAIDRFRVTGDGELRTLLGTRAAGDRVAIAAFRRHKLIELHATLAAAPPTRYELVGVAEAGPAAVRYQAWLGEPHPGAQTLATVTATARWV
ncbi:MAG TPA: PDZ domain-containing protein [Kofleriaceae bacterium]|jgi:predicted metalloprotease with PDZ domain|nr:PDZ domain-containing protein [Kofleriaceae bacterium]